MISIQLFETFNFKILITLITILAGTSLSSSEELLELTCSHDSQCSIYKNATHFANCVDGFCQCQILFSDQIVKCTPEERKMQNMIAGTCPCNLMNTYCKDKEQICYCKEGYFPSVDRRRCIPKRSMLGGLCEMDSQCYTGSNFANCNETLKRCVCNKNFLKINSSCVAALEGSCASKNDCKAFGETVECSPGHSRCVCGLNEIVSRNRSCCIKGSTFNEECELSEQCQLTLGPGAACVKNYCNCDENYYLSTIPNMKCKKKILFGQYCNTNSDCELNEYSEEAKMECWMGECRCKNTFRLIENLLCAPKNASIKKALNQINFIFMSILFYLSR